MLLSKTVIVKWNPANIKHYKFKGYTYTKYGDEFEVNIGDLSKGSHALVKVKCDCPDCKNPYLKPMTYNTYNKNIHEDGKYYCQKCGTKLFGKQKMIETKLKNSISFYEWCYINLSKEEADNIMLRWDYDKNIRDGKILTPKDVGFSSNGLNKKGYWFKWLDNTDHESELKSINRFVGGQKGSLDCFKCNTISTTHPNLSIFLVNKEDAYKYSYGSGEKILMNCPDCGYEKKMSIGTLISQGFSCCRCSDKRSYPEKFMFNFLEQLLNKDFQAQLSRKTFTWCGNYKYDFYIDNLTCIIETHGLQHYEGGFDRIKSSSSRYINTLENTQENDMIKEKLAKDNDIINYIILDCRHSELKWIKNSIMQSYLPNLLNFKEEDINWLKCHEFACSSRVREACDLWNSGIENISEIIKIMKMGRNAIKNFLKKGTELGWCNYSPKIYLSHKEK